MAPGAALSERVRAGGAVGSSAQSPFCLGVCTVPLARAVVLPGEEAGGVWEGRR